MVLRNASILTRLHLSDTDILDHFVSADAFFQLLTNLHILSEPKIPDQGVGIVSLIRALPDLKLLYLSRVFTRVVWYHLQMDGWWSLEPTENFEAEGPTTATLSEAGAQPSPPSPPFSSLKELILGRFISFGEMG